MKRAMAVLAISLGLTNGAFAQSSSEDFRLHLGFGADNVLQSGNENRSPYVNFEVASPAFIDLNVANFRIRAAADLSGDGIWSGIGPSLEILLPANFYFEANILAGLYGDLGGVDLGHVIQFRSQGGVGYKFTEHTDVAITFSHKSNGGIGDDGNPGSEAIQIRFGRAF